MHNNSIHPHFSQSSNNLKNIEIPFALIEILGHRLAFKLYDFHFRRNGLSARDESILLEERICEIYHLEEGDVVKYLKNKKPQELLLNLPFSQCTWCSCWTVQLHSHHYPIPRCKGGRATVDICPNCHAEYHKLVGCGVLIIKKEYADMLEACYEENVNA